MTRACMTVRDRKRHQSAPTSADGGSALAAPAGTQRRLRAMRMAHGHAEPPEARARNAGSRASCADARLPCVPAPSPFRDPLRCVRLHALSTLSSADLKANLGLAFPWFLLYSRLRNFMRFSPRAACAGRRRWQSFASRYECIRQYVAADAPCKIGTAR
eukprot:249026-Pleurochrysis_carterae.AAC.1